MLSCYKVAQSVLTFPVSHHTTCRSLDSCFHVVYIWMLLWKFRIFHCSILVSSHTVHPQLNFISRQEYRLLLLGPVCFKVLQTLVSARCYWSYSSNQCGYSSPTYSFLQQDIISPENCHPMAVFFLIKNWINVTKKMSMCTFWKSETELGHMFDLTVDLTLRISPNEHLQSRCHHPED